MRGGGGGGGGGHTPRTGCSGSQRVSPVADPGGVHWVPWNPSFIKGCHRKYQHAQTHYIHYAHTRASFTVAITHDLPVSTQ